MSSGATGGCSRSRSPARTPASSAVHSTSSSRLSGKSRPFGTPPTWWFARPIRCRNVPIDRGEPSWQTSSTGPTSMPSSSDAVATSARRSPGAQPRLDVAAPRRRQAAVVRGDDEVRVLDAEVVGAQALGELVRDALGHAPVVDEDERRAVLEHVLGDPVEHARPSATVEIAVSSSPVGQLDRDVEVPRRRAVDDDRARRAPGPTPLSIAATVSIGRCVAESPMRWSRRPWSATSRSSRSRLSARWLPRLSRQTAWISSTITVSVCANIARPDAEVSSR